MIEHLYVTQRNAPVGMASLALRTHDMGGTDYSTIVFLPLDDAAAITRGEDISNNLDFDLLCRNDPARMHMRRVPPDADDNRCWEFCLNRDGDITPVKRITRGDVDALQREKPDLSIAPYDDNLERALRGRALTIQRARALNAPQLTIMHDSLTRQMKAETSDHLKEMLHVALLAVLSKANVAMMARKSHVDVASDNLDWLRGNATTFEDTRAIFYGEDLQVLSYITGAKHDAVKMMDALVTAPQISQLAISLGADVRMISGFDNDPYALGFCAGQIDNMRVMDMQIYQAALEEMTNLEVDVDDTPAP